MTNNDEDTEEKNVPYSIGAGRGLLSDKEREALTREKSDPYRQSTRMKIHNRLALIEDDLKFMKEHAPGIYEEVEGSSTLLGNVGILEFEADIEEIKEAQQDLLESLRPSESEGNQGEHNE